MVTHQRLDMMRLVTIRKDPQSVTEAGTIVVRRLVRMVVALKLEMDTVAMMMVVVGEVEVKEVVMVTIRVATATTRAVMATTMLVDMATTIRAAMATTLADMAIIMLVDMLIITIQADMAITTLLEAMVVQTLKLPRLRLLPLVIAHLRTKIGDKPSKHSCTYVNFSNFVK